MFSGSTACIVYVNLNTLYCANLGDSRAMLFSKMGPNQPPPSSLTEIQSEKKHNQLGEKWICKPLSYDHKGEEEREAYRIKVNGGRVFPYRDEMGDQMGPYRVWIKEENIPGLAMTRSFGDYVASTVGVIAEPEVLTHEIGKGK